MGTIRFCVVALLFSHIYRAIGTDWVSLSLFLILPIFLILKNTLVIKYGETVFLRGFWLIN